MEQLVKEAAEEATKKGWCDAETGKANHDRDSNHNKVVELNAEVEKLEAQRFQLNDNLEVLREEIATLEDSLDKTTKIRTDEKADNLDTIDKAKEGLEAVKEAYKVLDEFYSKAKKATVSLVEVKARASPIDEDAPEAPSGGAYTGGQQKAGGILAMLDVIISDFERTIKVTTANEKQAHRDFTEFDRTTKSSITSKTSSKTQDEMSLKNTETMITEDMSFLEKHMKMLDDTLKEIEDLKPACIDTGMSYEERAQKRKDEIEALGEALCQLDPEKVESECA
jgi:chromosome segregation ATPase